MSGGRKKVARKEASGINCARVIVNIFVIAVSVLTHHIDHLSPYEDVSKLVPQRPLLYLLDLRLHLKVLATASVDVHLFQLHELRLVPELVTNNEQNKYGQQNVIDDEVLRAEGFEESGVT